MIRGTVNARHEVTFPLRVRGPSGAVADLVAVVDTGFSSALTLPASVISPLGLVRQSVGSAILGDGTSRAFDIFEAEVEWDGGWRAVFVSAIGSDVLVGMRLLAGHRVRFEVVPGGAVEIEARP